MGQEKQKDGNFRPRDLMKVEKEAVSLSGLLTKPRI